MQEFTFHRAKTVEEVLEMLETSGEAIKLVAGGTDVMITLRNEELPAKVNTVLDISAVPELGYVKHEQGNGSPAGTLRIGAATPLRDIAADKLVKENIQVLHHAADSVGSQQIRSRATMGGNIITAAQCADTIPALLVLDAVLVLRTKGGVREVPIHEFFTGPKKTAIKPNELLTEIYFPVPGPNARGIFEKLIRRAAVAKSRLTACAIAEQDSGRIITDLRLTVGSTLPCHARFTPVEDMLKGQKATMELIERAAQAAGDHIVEVGGRRWSTDYKKPVTERLTARCLKAVLEVE